MPLRRFVQSTYSAATLLFTTRILGNRMANSKQTSPEKRIGDRKHRSYTHNKCGAETTVSGSSLTNICNPLDPVPATYCSQCEDVFPLCDYTWSDSGESIVAFRERMEAAIPPFWQKVDQSSGYAMLVGALIAAGVGAWLPDTLGWRIGCAIGAFILAFFVLAYVFGEAVRIFCGVDFQACR